MPLDDTKSHSTRWPACYLFFLFFFFLAKIFQSCTCMSERIWELPLQSDMHEFNALTMKPRFSAFHSLIQHIFLCCFSLSPRKEKKKKICICKEWSEKLLMSFIGWEGAMSYRVWGEKVNFILRRYLLGVIISSWCTDLLVTLIYSGCNKKE